MQLTEVEASLQPELASTLQCLLRQIRRDYAMDELWDGKHELKFRRGGRTLTALYLQPDRLTALIIFGRAERERFLQRRHNFSAWMQAQFDGSRTLHDGKWMYIELTAAEQVTEIMEMLAIKRKPQRPAPVHQG